MGQVLWFLFFQIRKPGLRKSGQFDLLGKEKKNQFCFFSERERRSDGRLYIIFIFVGSYMFSHLFHLEPY